MIENAHPGVRTFDPFLSMVNYVQLLLFLAVFGAFHQVGGLFALCKKLHVFTQKRLPGFFLRDAGTAGVEHRCRPWR